MFDITKHKWTDGTISRVTQYVSNVPGSDHIILHIAQEAVLLEKSDSTAIAKHFHDLMSIDEKIDFWNVMFKDNDLGIGKLSKVNPKV